MRTSSEVFDLLDELNQRPACDLEDQDLDFKEWPARSKDKAVAMVIHMAICMANGGGGTVVFGVNDKAVGRAKAILGVPLEIDVNRLRKSVYDSTDPKLTPVFEELHVPEGSGRVLVMLSFGGLAPYTDTSGAGTIRIGKDCQPLTGTLRRKTAVETGETDYTATAIEGEIVSLLSPSAIEALRGAARQERAPVDLLRLSDLDLLDAIGVIRDRHLTRAGVLIAGTEDAIRVAFPGYVWTHLRLRSDTDIADRMDGTDALPVALRRITDRIMANNPIATVASGMFHFEYRTYPEIALREVLLNAFCHADYRLAGPILVKQLPDKLEISNPGGFIGGVSPANILHHQPTARNPRLVDALARLRLVNRANVGIPRIFEALLIEGKEPPIIDEQGESVKVTFLARQPSVAFRTFVADESAKDRILGVDQLLVLQHLLGHGEIDTPTAARICQRRDVEARGLLARMERDLGYLEHGGAGRGQYWTLASWLFQRLAEPGAADRDRRIDWEAAKARVYSVLRQRADRGEPGLSNADIRRMTHLNRYQVIRLMHELLHDHAEIVPPGRGKYARYSIAAHGRDSR